VEERANTNPQPHLRTRETGEEKRGETGRNTEGTNTAGTGHPGIVYMMCVFNYVWVPSPNPQKQTRKKPV
jgi:hypothetical protein